MIKLNLENLKNYGELQKLRKKEGKLIIVKLIDNKLIVDTLLNNEVVETTEFSKISDVTKKYDGRNWEITTKDDIALTSEEEIEEKLEVMEDKLEEMEIEIEKKEDKIEEIEIEVKEIEEKKKYKNSFKKQKIEAILNGEVMTFESRTQCCIELETKYNLGSGLIDRILKSEKPYKAIKKYKHIDGLIVRNIANV